VSNQQPACASRSNTEPRSGFTLLELLIGTAILATAACGLIASFTVSFAYEGSNRETTRATEIARRVVERMHGLPLRDVFASFNSDALDDPDGPGSAPGPRFPMGPGDSDSGLGSFVVVVEFPVTPGTGELREDLTNPRLGMPRDLDLDGTLDSEDHSTDYRVLPTKVRVEWRGATGARSYEVATVLMDQALEASSGG
jgi:prepilin-type N-terminal cleavage/methylation domain-containing protein